MGRPLYHRVAWVGIRGWEGRKEGRGGRERSDSDQGDVSFQQARDSCEVPLCHARRYD